MIRKDGFYINHYKGKSQYNEYVEFSSILFFTKTNLVLFLNDKSIINPENITFDILDEDYGVELTNELGKYVLSGNNIKITYPLNDISLIDKEYQMFEGIITESSLILDYIICNWSERIADYYKRTLTTKQKFKFYSFTENRYIDDTPQIINSSFAKNEVNTKIINDNKNDEIRKYNSSRNGAIAFFFGFFGALIGVLFGGFSGFLIGAISGVVIGFVIKSILD